MLRKAKILIKWSPFFAYAIGIIATDGNLSPDGRHISITSKDLSLLEDLKKCYELTNKIGRKGRGGSKNEMRYFVLQFGDSNFYDFLNLIGLYPAKSKTIAALKVPDPLFWDFLRGCLDGDGNISTFMHPESIYPQLRIRFVSASRAFLEWIHATIMKLSLIRTGYISSKKSYGVFVLSFGKSDSIKLIRLMYYDGAYPCLERKQLIAQKWAGGGTGYTH